MCNRVDHVFIIPGLGFEGMKFEVLYLQSLRADAGFAEEHLEKLCGSPESKSLWHLGQQKPGTSPLNDQESMPAENDLTWPDTLQWREGADPDGQPRQLVFGDRRESRIVGRRGNRLSDHGFQQRAAWPALAPTAPQSAIFAEAESNKASTVLEQARRTGWILGDNAATQEFMEGFPGGVKREPFFLWADRKHRARSLCL